MKLAASVLEASTFTVNTDGGSGGTAGGNGRYIYAASIPIGTTGTKQWVVR